jgi:hypothetical protein
MQKLFFWLYLKVEGPRKEQNHSNPLGSYHTRILLSPPQRCRNDLRPDGFLLVDGTVASK